MAAAFSICTHCRESCGLPAHAAAHVERDLRCALHSCRLPARYHGLARLRLGDDHAPRLVRWAATAQPLAACLESLSLFASEPQGVDAMDLYEWRAAREDALLQRAFPAPAPALMPVRQQVQAQEQEQEQKVVAPPPQQGTGDVSKGQGKWVALGVVAPLLLTLAIAAVVSAKRR